jgi:hypothetical protein
MIVPMIEGEIDLKGGRVDQGISALRAAAQFEDDLYYDEPPAWLIPVRESLGAALLAANRISEAEAVYREDLTQFPNNGWSLFGLAKTLALEHREKESAAVSSEFTVVWAKADVTIDSSCLCQSGSVPSPR